MTEKNETKLSEIKKPSPVFNDRLAGKEHWIGRVCFELQALPSSVEMYLQSRAIFDDDNAALLMDRLRLGVVGIRGLCDENGLAVKPKFDIMRVLGREFPYLSWETLDGLSSRIQDELAAEISKLSLYGDQEAQAQDFTQTSSAASAAAEEADAAAQSASE